MTLQFGVYRGDKLLQFGKGSARLSPAHPTVDIRDTLYSNRRVKGFEWNDRKNGILKKSRGVSFDDVVLEIAEGRLLDMLINANHPGQAIYVIRLKGYVHCVPAIMHQDVIRLITIYPSRKMNDKYKESL